MAWRNDSERFGAVAMFLHWSIALLVVTQFVLANLAEQAEAEHSLMAQIAMLARHKSVGISILGLAVLRILWRLGNPPPPPPLAMPTWQRWVSGATHWLFYALLFAMPVTGWAMSSAANFPVSWFGIVTLPDFVQPSETLKDDLAQVHGNLAGLLFMLAVLHVAAALKHHFIDRDGVLLRMFGVVRSRP